MDRESVELEPGAEWRADPTGRHQYRLWHDGWTERVSDFGVRAVDPYTGSATTPTLDAVLGPAPARPSRVSRRASTSTPAKTIGGVLLLIGALLAGIGSMLPVFDRLSADDVSYVDLPGGYGGHGLWVGLIGVVLAFIALLGVLRSQSSRIPAAVALLVSVSLLVIVYSDWHDVDDAVTLVVGHGLGFTSGISLALAGAVLAVLGSVVALVGQRR